MSVSPLLCRTEPCWLQCRYAVRASAHLHKHPRSRYAVSLISYTVLA